MYVNFIFVFKIWFLESNFALYLSFYPGQFGKVSQNLTN